MATALEKLAQKLGLDTSDLEARQSVVTGIYIGRKAAKTKPTELHPEPRDMWILYFEVGNGEYQSVNMMASANDERLVHGKVYTAGWTGNRFDIRLAEGDSIGNGDVALQ